MRFLLPFFLPFFLHILYWVPEAVHTAVATAEAGLGNSNKFFFSFWWHSREVKSYSIQRSETRLYAQYNQHLNIIRSSGSSLFLFVLNSSSGCFHCHITQTICAVVCMENLLFIVRRRWSKPSPSAWNINYFLSLIRSFSHPPNPCLGNLEIFKFIYFKIALIHGCTLGFFGKAYKTHWCRF